MKKSTLCLLFLVISTVCFSQQTPSLTKQQYLLKSKNQKIAGFILLGAGVTTLAIISNGRTSFDILPMLAIGGTVSTLASIPLLIASSRNKRKAINAAAFFDIQKTESSWYAGNGFNAYPALNFKISLGN